MVLDALCVLLQEEPTLNGRTELMSNPSKLLARLRGFGKDDIPPSVRTELRQYYGWHLRYSEVQSVSDSAGALRCWICQVLACDDFARKIATTEEKVNAAKEAHSHATRHLMVLEAHLEEKDDIYF